MPPGWQISRSLLQQRRIWVHEGWLMSSHNSQVQRTLQQHHKPRLMATHLSVSNIHEQTGLFLIGHYYVLEHALCHVLLQLNCRDTVKSCVLDIRQQLQPLTPYSLECYFICFFIYFFFFLFFFFCTPLTTQNIKPSRWLIAAPRGQPTNWWNQTHPADQEGHKS